MRRRRRHSATPYVYDPVPRRDERFHDLYNQGVNAEAFLCTTRRTPARPKALMMLYKRLREIDVPEMMAEHHRRDEGASPGATTATCPGSSGTRPGTR